MSKTYGNISIRGVLKKIIFHRPESGFMIGSFAAAASKGEDEPFPDGDLFPENDPDDIFNDNSTFIALGEILNPQVGMEYSLTGEFKDNHKYGRQFAFEFFKTVEPTDLNGIHKYLVRICKFVGTATASYIIDQFGSDTMRVLREDPERVAAQVRGVTPTRAAEIQATLLENAATEAAMIELETMLDMPGMIKSTPMRLIEKYGSNAPAEVRRNPYLLTQFRGIGFILADRVAIQIGYDPAGLERKKAVAEHVLDEAGQVNGDVWISRDDLQLQMLALVPVNNIFDGVDALIASGGWEFWNGAYTSAGKSEAEKYIAERLIWG
jgi:exodeoxyribonuclease V alpha subunit